VTAHIPDADKIVQAIIALAERFPGQPVAVVADGKGKIEAGVIGLIDPTEDDWFWNPVPLGDLPERAQAAML
jgi:hypothetical protein